MNTIEEIHARTDEHWRRHFTSTIAVAAEFDEDKNITGYRLEKIIIENPYPLDHLCLGDQLYELGGLLIRKWGKFDTLEDAENAIPSFVEKLMNEYHAYRSASK